MGNSHRTTVRSHFTNDFLTVISVPTLRNSSWRFLVTSQDAVR